MIQAPALFNCYGGASDPYCYHSGPLIMSLKEIIEPLLRDGGEPMSRYTRAAKLFEFQISLFYQKSFEHLIAGKEDSKLTRARLRVGIRFLQKAENDLERQNVFSIQGFAADKDYQRIFDDLFVANGGWSKILHSMQVGEFDQDIKARRKLAQIAVNIIDFSYRFSKNPPKIEYRRRRNPGGLEAAKYVVRNTTRPAVGASTIKQRWAAYRATAIFLYLMLNRQFDLQPPRLNSKAFTDELLRQAENVDQLRRYFRAYQAVQSALSDLRYNFVTLDLDVGGPTPELHALDFSPEMKRALSDWVQAADV
jgi:hypothetical protein